MTPLGARATWAAVLLPALVWCAPASAAAITPARAVEALKRHVCFSHVWWADPYVRLGQTATVDVRTDGRTAWLWSEDMRAVPKVRRWADSYIVVAREGGSVVTQRSGYNVELLRGEPAFERERRRVYGGATQRLQVELPVSCEPRLDPETPLKAEMWQAVVRSLTTAVATWGRRPPPGGVRMTIAEFNVDYPETFALRHDTGEVLRLGLLSGGPGTEAVSRQYAVTPIPRGVVAAQLRRLILKHGRVEVIAAR